MKNKRLETLHNKSCLRKYIEKSKQCGCFYCLRTFKSAEIHEWVGIKGNDALCPKCGMDAVLSDTMCKLTTKTLKAMNAYWFCSRKSIKIKI